MLKQSSYNKKGQWFLISAVVATGIFLAISGVFKTYVDIDTSKPAVFNEDYYYNTVRHGFLDALSLSQNDCANIDSSLYEYVRFSKKEMAKLGYLLNITYTISGCSATIGSISLVSEKMMIWEGEKPVSRCIFYNQTAGKYEVNRFC